MARGLSQGEPAQLLQRPPALTTLALAMPATEDKTQDEGFAP